MTPVADHPVVAEIVRSGFVEGRHRGVVVALDVDGQVAWSVGPADQPILPRSCNKPIQALAMVEAGLDLPAELLAIACASHSAEQIHLDAARRVLAGAGLGEGVLQCPEDWPILDADKVALAAAGGRPTRLQMNCSGKHAAMLATCVVNGWPADTYLAPDHPLQQAILATFARVTGEPVAVEATDGCGAPLLSTSPIGLARAFAHLATATEGPAHRVAEAIRRHPELVSGTTRDEAALLGAVPGAIGKAGAEACHVVALPDGRAVALKIDDGGTRARPVVMAAALARTGLLDEPGVDAAAVRATGEHALLGGGRPVGEIRAVLAPA